MVKLLTCFLVVPLFLAATPAHACFPDYPTISVESGSARLGASDFREIARLVTEFSRSERGTRVVGQFENKQA